MRALLGLGMDVRDGGPVPGDGIGVAEDGLLICESDAWYFEVMYRDRRVAGCRMKAFGDFLRSAKEVEAL